jgi:hypothetical protein
MSTLSTDQNSSLDLHRRHIAVIAAVAPLAAPGELRHLAKFLFTGDDISNHIATFSEQSRPHWRN